MAPHQCTLPTASIAWLMSIRGGDCVQARRQRSLFQRPVEARSDPTDDAHLHTVLLILFSVVLRVLANLHDFFNHPPARLPSRKPIWSDMTPVDVTSRWTADWQSSVSNSYLISDPTTRPAGYDLRRSTWSLLNQFRTGQGRCAADHKWRMAASDKVSVR